MIDGRPEVVLVRLKGLHAVKKTLADGSKRTYWYAWRGGPALKGEPGSPEFIASHREACATVKKPDGATMADLIRQFDHSPEYRSRAESTKRAYRTYLNLIDAKFGGLPVEAMADPRIRGDFKDWRDSMADKPRKADYAWSVLAKVLNFVKDRGRITVNPCDRGGRLSKPDRTDKIWTDADISALMAVASFEVAAVVFMAMWTGQRQGDLLRLPWSAYRDGVFRFKQSKNGSRVAFPASGPLRDLIALLPKRGPIMLTSSDQSPWTGDGFRASFGAACERAAIDGITFHDLRGTFSTRAARAGATSIEIACVTGHAVAGAGALDSSYIERGLDLATHCITRLEENEKATEFCKLPVNRPSSKAKSVPRVRGKSRSTATG